MRIIKTELRTIQLPLVRPFRTSFGTQTSREVLMISIINENGVAKMRQVQGIEVPAGGAVTLTPGGFHIMFMGLNAPFAAGESVPVTLQFEKAGEVKVNFEIKPTTYNPMGAGHGSAHKH